MNIPSLYIINKVQLKIWLPMTITTFLSIALTINDVNFTLSLYDFIIGNTFDILGVIIAIGWLTSLAWGIIAYHNRAALSANATENAAREQGSLYKIKELRTNVLKHISASTYNEESRQVIERFNPTPTEIQQPKQVNKPHVNNQPSNISNKFSNNGKKKEENSTGKVEDNQQNQESNKPNSEAPAKETAKYAAVNTAIKGESYATPVELDKYKERIQRLKQKRNKS